MLLVAQPVSEGVEPVVVEVLGLVDDECVELGPEDVDGLGELLREHVEPVLGRRGLVPEVGQLERGPAGLGDAQAMEGGVADPVVLGGELQVGGELPVEAHEEHVLAGVRQPPGVLDGQHRLSGAGAAVDGHPVVACQAPQRDGLLAG